MRKIIRFITHIVFYTQISILLGCDKKPESKLREIFVPEKVSLGLNIKDVAKSINRVQLETKKGSFLGFIKDVKIFNGSIYIVELNKISVFDLNGGFQGLLGKHGNGPEEFNKVISFEIDEKSGLIYVTSGFKLLVYNTENELVLEKVFQTPLEYIKIIDQTPIIISEKIGIKVNDGFANQTNLYKLSSTLELMDSIPVRTVILDGITVGGFSVRYFLSNIDDGLFLYKPVFTPENLLRDTLYQVNEKSIEPFIKLVFERPQSLNKQGYQTLLINNLNISKSYILCEYDQDWERMMFLFNRKTSVGYNLKSGLLDEDGESVLIRPLNLNNDSFYFVKEAKYSNSSTEEMNPIIGIVFL